MLPVDFNKILDAKWEESHDRTFFLKELKILSKNMTIRLAFFIDYLEDGWAVDLTAAHDFVTLYYEIYNCHLEEKRFLSSEEARNHIDDFIRKACKLKCFL